MNCQRCAFLDVTSDGAALDYRCQFTGAAICDQDLGEDFTCPLTLPVRVLRASTLVRTVLAVTMARGTYRALLAQYPERKQDELVAFARAEGLEAVGTG